MIACFAGGGIAVMTGRAGTQYLIVVCSNNRPAGDDMTGVTLVGGWCMGDGLVVTGAATVHQCFIVIHDQYRREGCGGMAGIAAVCRWCVAGGLTNRGHAVMTADAGARYLGVIHCQNIQPAGGGMAGIAVFRGTGVAGGFAGGDRAIVAVQT